MASPDELLKEWDGDVYRRVKQSAEGIVIGRVMKHTRGNQQQAATILGLSRATLRKKLLELGLPTTWREFR